MSLNPTSPPSLDPRQSKRNASPAAGSSKLWIKCSVGAKFAQGAASGCPTHGWQECRRVACTGKIVTLFSKLLALAKL
eukprot:418213-Rhodomonas_salina.1